MMLGYCRPAVYRHHAVFGIQSDDNLPGKRFARLAHEVGIFHSRRADKTALGLADEFRKELDDENELWASTWSKRFVWEVRWKALFVGI